MTEVVVTDRESTVVVRGDASTVVVADKTSSKVITAGMMPPNIVSSITNSSDIDTTNLQDGGMLIYNATTNKWTATNLLEKQIFEAGQF